jgi:hypothetical protein
LNQDWQPPKRVVSALITHEVHPYSLQGGWDETIIPDVGEGTVSEIMAKTRHLYTFDIAVCDIQFGLRLAEAVDHETGEMEDT